MGWYKWRSSSAGSVETVWMGSGAAAAAPRLNRRPNSVGGAGGGTAGAMLLPCATDDVLLDGTLADREADLRIECDGDGSALPRGERVVEAATDCTASALTIRGDVSVDASCFWAQNHITSAVSVDRAVERLQQRTRTRTCTLEALTDRLMGRAVAFMSPSSRSTSNCTKGP